ncbi:germinal center-associated signaling and motility protein isoform X1 [Callorhinus ursinus]|uniref:Germinal center-associated signaling and motility protein isoform X1 n=1 Tax=Callorhinus ursinus TaxID=34884 RepID=A0A3Q7P7T7_CALUR|nr:germinal center-associated signaling and motility protein isoform X1 [Callorhinus ursinus]
MGNSPLRENRWQQNTQEIPWTLENQSFEQRTSRCWDCYVAEGCFCLPWKKVCICKAKPDSSKTNKGMSSAPVQQDSADQSSSEDLCYTHINHVVLGRRLSGISSEGFYENVSPKTKTSRKSLGETETSYALLRVPSSPRHLSSPEDEYELVVPSRISFHSLQQPHVPLLPSKTQVSYL